MRVEELATAHRVSVDTVRYYQKIGVLHRPARNGRVALYDESHERRLDEVRRLSDEGFSLAQIQRMGEHGDDSLLEALQTLRDTPLSFDELTERSGLDHELVRLAIDVGLVRPLRDTADQDPDMSHYSSGALSMLRTAAGLLDADMPLDDLVGLALRHAVNMEAVADDAVELFAKHFGGRPDGERAELAARLIPLVTDLVAQHFRETLVERATERVLAS